MNGQSFGDLALSMYGERFRQLVLYSIAVSQMGFCCAYFIFVGTNLRDLVMILSSCRIVLPDWVFILFQILVYIPLAWVRRIKNFGLTALIADAFILLGLGYIFSYDIFSLSQNGPKDIIPWINLQSFPLFIGTAMFSFEGISLMLPIVQSMEHPERFSRVLTACLSTVAAIFLTIGSLSYLSLGTNVETVIFLNLPKSTTTTSVQLLYVIAILLSFPLTIYPAIRITEQGRLINTGIFGISTGKQSNFVKWEKNLYRAALTTFLGVVAWLGSASLDKVVSVVGCFACIPLSFIYPALLHTHVTKSKLVKAKDWVIVVVGTILMVYTTAVTIREWAANGAPVPPDRCHDAQGRRFLFRSNP